MVRAVALVAQDRMTRPLSTFPRSSPERPDPPTCHLSRVGGYGADDQPTNAVACALP
jgi:hypothetical protein